MATYKFKLHNPPSDYQDKRLWLQHVAGLIYFEDARQYAIDKIDEKIDSHTREKIIKGIDDTIYGLMMIFDGVTGELKNSEYAVTLETSVNLIQKSDNDSRVIEKINLFDSDGMCMGYHGWIEGDFGEYPIASKRE